MSEAKGRLIELGSIALSFFVDTSVANSCWMISSLFSFFITYIFILVGVAYFTLLERKGLAYFQQRKGPNKVGFRGILQPLADAFKLFLKEFIIPKRSNQFCFIFAPLVALYISLILWHAYPSYYQVTCLG